MITSKQIGAVTMIDHDYSNGDNVGLMYLTSDLHIDSVYCNRDKLLADFEEAKNRNAYIMLFGDIFDAMQGKFDPRRSMDELRPEYRKANYYDIVIQDVAKILKPYAENILLISPGNHECLDEKAEVLTRSGWKPIADVTMDDDVLSIQNWDKVPLYAKPLAVHSYEHHGEMVRLKSAKIDMLMTPNHRVAYIPQRADYIHYFYAENMLSQFQVPVSTQFNNPEFDITDDEIRYAAWVLTDGSIRSGIHYIFQSKVKMIEHIESLLNRMGVAWNKTERARDIKSVNGVKLIKPSLPQTAFNILESSKSYVNHIVGKKGCLPDWVFKLSQRQFDIFIEELILGDGSVPTVRKSAAVLYGEKPFLDEVQRACVVFGYRAHISQRMRNGVPDYFALNISKNPTLDVTVSKIKHTRESFDGRVYCLTTVTGNFMIRRNGKAYLTGNSAVLKNASISMIDRLVYTLNIEHGGHVLQGGYGGWVRINAHRGSYGSRLSVKMKYHHGFGGDAPVTRGVIHTNRQSVYIKDADIIVNGHNHNAYYVPIVSESLTNNGTVIFQTTHHIRTPGYKQEYGDGSKGWAVEKGFVPKPIGGAFVQYTLVGNGIRKGKPKELYADIRVTPHIHSPEYFDI